MRAGTGPDNLAAWGSAWPTPHRLPAKASAVTHQRIGRPQQFISASIVAGSNSDGQLNLPPRPSPEFPGTSPDGIRGLPADQLPLKGKDNELAGEGFFRRGGRRDARKPFAGSRLGHRRHSVV